MKTLFKALFALLAFIPICHAQIEFQEMGHDWDQIIRQAQKPIFVDVYTDWCRPCKLMDQTAFQDEEAGKYFQKNYVAIKANVTEGKPAKWFGDSLSITNFPTLLIFDSDGNLLHYTKGAFLEGEQLIAFAQDALKPENQYITLMNKFEAGDRSVATMQQLIKATSVAMEPITPVLQHYFSEIPKSEWSDATHWRILEAGLTQTSEPLFQYLLYHKEEFAKKNGVATVQQLIQQVISKEAEQLLYSYQPDYEQLSRLEMVAEFAGETGLLLPFKLDLSAAAKDWTAFTQQAKQFSECEADESHSDTYNLVAWNLISEITPNDEQLSLAYQFAKLALEYNPVPYVKDTYACVRYRQGFIEEAIQVEKEALAEAQNLPSEAERLDGYQATLNKMINRQKLFE